MSRYLSAQVLTHAHLLKILSYDSETGVFTWIVHRTSMVRAGDVAGTLDGAGGYIKIWIDGKQYRAHRLAWLYVTGKWPEHEIDHENRNKSDTSFKNLRPVTRKQNCENLDPIANNTSGHRGVCWNKKERAWCAQIKHNRKQHHLGWFKDLQAAVQARKAAEMALFTHSEVCQ